jgi:phosphoesterase RecJ-like protein
MQTNSFNDIAEKIRQAKTIGVASHIRPDADALGSTIAFSLWLKANGKTVTAWNEEGATQKFHYLPRNEMVTPPPASPQ